MKPLNPIIKLRPSGAYIEKEDLVKRMLGEKPVAEYTDLSCGSPETANAVLLYLNEHIDQQEERPSISAYAEKSTVRITYGDNENRGEWDMQLMGYRDGLQAGADAARRECAEIAQTAYVYGPGSLALERDGAIAARDIIVKAITERVGQPVGLYPGKVKE